MTNLIFEVIIEKITKLLCFERRTGLLTTHLGLLTKLGN
jgi:hypothetical protein